MTQSPVSDRRLLRLGPPTAQAGLALVGLLGGVDALRLTASALVLMVCAALVARPLEGTPLLVVLAVVVVLVALECHGDSGNVGWFGVCLAGGWAASAAPPRPALVVAALCLAVFVVEQVVVSDRGWGAWVAGTAVSVAACLAGRRQAALVVQLREAQAGLAARAAAEERTRIAHELHDVIGHALTVSLLHVTSARLALDDDPVEAAAALAEAERLGQQSLAEVRAVVGLMREDGGTVPLPGTPQLDDLVASFRSAGTDVDWAVEGELAGLTATEGLVVYRIVQEALTNVARHAPGAAVLARVTRDGAGTRVVVDSSGPAPVVVHEGSGLAGMRQRAEAVGGWLTAGPSGPGWRVEAVLP